MKALASLAEKVALTYLQALASLLLLADQLGATTAQAAAIASIPAALTALVNGLPAVPAGLPWALDALLRTIRTYAVSFVGLLIAAPVFSLDLSLASAAAAGALPAALAVLKAAVASRIGNTATAALLPASLDG